MVLKTFERGAPQTRILPDQAPLRTFATPSLGRTTAAGMMWLSLQNVIGRLIALLSQFVTAAILSPRDFGLIGLAFTVSAAGAVLVNFGVDSVLLQRHRALRLWLGPAFWCTFGLGILGFMVVLTISPIAARIYHAPAIPLLAGIVALSMPVTALGAVPSILLRSRLRFRHFATICFVEILGIQGLTVLLAYTGFGAMSFAIPLPVVAVCKTIALWYCTRPDIRGGLVRVRRAKYLMGNSAAVFGTSVVQALISQGDYVALGLFGTETVVGSYFFAFKMASQPLLLLASSLSGALIPTLSSLRHSPRSQGHAAIRAAKMLGLVIMPVAVLQAALIEPATHIVFGAKWEASIPLMQILSIGIALDAIAWVAAALLTSRGGFRKQFLYTVTCAPVFFAFIAVGAREGLALGVAVDVECYYAVVAPAFSYAVFRKDGLTFARLAWIYLLPGGLAALSAGGALEATALLGCTNDLARICLGTPVFVALSPALLWVADPKGFGDVRSLARDLIGRRR